MAKTWAVSLRKSMPGCTTCQKSPWHLVVNWSAELTAVTWAEFETRLHWRNGLGAVPLSSVSVWVATQITQMRLQQLAKTSQVLKDNLIMQPWSVPVFILDWNNISNKSTVISQVTKHTECLFNFRRRRCIYQSCHTGRREELFFAMTFSLSLVQNSLVRCNRRDLFLVLQPLLRS